VSSPLSLITIRLATSSLLTSNVFVSVVDDDKDAARELTVALPLTPNPTRAPESSFLVLFKLNEYVPGGIGFVNTKTNDAYVPLRIAPVAVIVPSAARWIVMPLFVLSSIIASSNKFLPESVSASGVSPTTLSCCASHVSAPLLHTISTGLLGVGVEACEQLPLRNKRSTLPAAAVTDSGDCPSAASTFVIAYALP